MTDTQITIETVDGSMGAFMASPDGDARGAVIVVQEAFGVTSHIEDVARRLATAGWLAIAPAFFHRQGSPVLGYDDLVSLGPILGQLSGKGFDADVSGALDHLQREGFTSSRIGVIGFCMGGTVSFFAAANHKVGAAVSFYGPGLTGGGVFGMPALVDLAPKLQTPWLGLYGDLDQNIPTADVETLRAAVEKASVPTEVVRYPDADHGFNCNDRPAVFNREAAADAWKRTLAWFDRHLQST